MNKPSQTFHANPDQQIANARDPFFLQVNAELSDKGFFIAAADDLITWARTGSLMWMTFGLACCAIVMMQMSSPTTPSGTDLPRGLRHGRPT
jgi:NADH:ubiquinone oxidoreductase subunit B-like Fe-S oxidoreductase